jgi:hypothetical protein
MASRTTPAVVADVECLLGDEAKNSANIPCAVLPYLRTLRWRGTPDEESARERTWQDLIDWHDRQHPRVLTHPTYPEVCEFVRGHWAETDNEENGDD